MRPVDRGSSSIVWAILFLPLACAPAETPEITPTPRVVERNFAPDYRLPNIDVQKYDLSFTLPPSGEEIVATANINFIVTSTGTNDLVLDFQGYEITAARFNNSAVSYERSPDGRLKLFVGAQGAGPAQHTIAI